MDKDKFIIRQEENTENRPNFSQKEVWYNPSTASTGLVLNMLQRDLDYSLWNSPHQRPHVLTEILGLTEIDSL